MKTAKELKLTPAQHKNLAKLTMFVRDKAEPPRFDMNSFFTGKDVDHNASTICPDIKEYECGTTACFLGYGIPAGIKARKRETWSNYCKRAFGINMIWRIFSIEHNTDAYDFLFNESHKNSKDAAARRGAWFLQNGLPDVHRTNLYSWETPRSFKPDWNAIEKIANQ
jgi:hypothetical protein